MTQQDGAPPASPDADQRINVLGIYATQFGSYTSLLWQVPALGLTAQSFLLMIALSSSKKGAVIMAACLSMVIAVASRTLMHEQRGFAISHAKFARELAEGIGLGTTLNSVDDEDAEPKLVQAGDQVVPMGFWTRTRVWLAEHWLATRPSRMCSPTGATVWDVAHTIYHIWRQCMLVFAFADIVIIVSAIWHLSWF
jgi:hypothetical protein